MNYLPARLENNMKTGMLETPLLGKLAGCSAALPWNPARHQVRKTNIALLLDSLKSLLLFVVFSHFLTCRTELDIERSSRWKAVMQRLI